jgi:hypothetical protein
LTSSNDQIGGEFIELIENYKTFKGKDILFSGISDNIDFYFKANLKEDFLKLKQFKTREQAIEYYLTHKNK